MAQGEKLHRVVGKGSLYDSAQYIKGVGPKRYELLNRLGVKTVEDLLYYFPRRNEDRSNLVPISRVKIGSLQTVKGEVLAFGLRKTRKRISIFELALGDDTGVIYGVWFNQPYMKDYFKVGQELILYGKVERFRKLQINAPEYEILSDDEEETIHMGRIVPVYPLTADLNQRSLRLIMKRAVDSYGSYPVDMLPGGVRERRQLLGLVDALRNIHFPADFAALARARQRLIFDEFFLLQLGIAIRKDKVKTGHNGISHEIKGELIESFKKLLPFELTESQTRVVKDIEEDMRSEKPMNRLLQGDVGSGKTIVAVYALVLTVQNGFQGAIMVPTEILAEQHYGTLSNLLLPLGINLSLLISSMTKGAKEKAKQDIKQGEANIVIGTHALIQEAIEFSKLGLVIIDEQHKFGVTQRAVLREKGLNPDVLVMTATPIPRTLALTVYGDLDVSTINELPPGRCPVRTYHVGEAKRGRVYAFVEKEVSAGRQAYIVYPLIEESEKIDLKAAENMYKKLSRDIFPQFKVGLIHGRMTGTDKEEIMRQFKQGEIAILVSTVVIEVGIDIPNASVMLIEHAERFGLSQLHQLRGRIGRGRHNSYCILLSDAKGEDARLRLEAMVHTQDGFRIAEEDLGLRGPGEFFGTRQHGLPEIRIGNIIADMKLMEAAREEAFGLVAEDPGLKKPVNAVIKANLKKKFQNYHLDLISVS